MRQLAQTTRPTIADCSKRIGVGEWAEQHGDELGPTGESARMAFCLMLLGRGGELGTPNVFQKLTEQTGGLYHRDAILADVGNRFVAYPILQRPWRAVNGPPLES